MIDKDSQNIYQQVLNSGLFNQKQDEPFFSHRGCDICNNGLGNNIYEIWGFICLYDAQYSPKDGYFEFQICGECLYKAHYGE